MKRVFAAMAMLFGLLASPAFAQTKPCADLLSAAAKQLSANDKAALKSVLESDTATAVTTQGAPLSAVYGELAAAGYMLALKSDLPPPLVSYEWAPAGRAACVVFDPTAPVVWTGPRVTLTTTMGAIEITLDLKGAPKTADVFLKNAKHGHYKGAAIYRIETGFIIQLGDLDAKGKYRKPKFGPVPLETSTNFHERGAVAMAHEDADVNTGQSTFYFDLADNRALNAKAGAEPNTTGYAVFGHVTKGMEVLDAIAKVELAPGGPFPGKQPKVAIVVERVEVVE